MPTLLVIKGPNQGEQVELNADRFVIGRNPDCQLVVPSPAVSRAHAEILRKSPTEFYIKDLGSRNKTLINGETVDPKDPIRLRDRDEIRICEFRFQYIESVALPPLPDHLRKEEPEEDEGPEEESTPLSTVMSSLDAAGGSSYVILEAQPADRLKLLLDVTNTLTRTLDLDSLLPKVLDSMFSVFRQADRAFMVLKEEGTGRLIPKAVKTRRERDEENARFSRKIVNQCLETGQAFLCEDAFGDKQFSMSQSIADFRIRSVICAPLQGSEGKVFGVLQLDTLDRSKKFTSEDLQLLAAVANQAALAMDNARMHGEMIARERLQRDMQFAKDVQRVLLPTQMPSVPGYEFHAFYKAASYVGGDFYAFVPLPNGQLAISVGDVAGKGVPAALLMARLTADVRSCVLSQSDPAKAVRAINDLLLQADFGDRFVTFALAILDPQRHVVTLVNAGHLSPVLRRHATDSIEEIAAGDDIGLPLGIDGNYDYKAMKAELLPGDTLYLFSDGILDATSASNERFGSERLMNAIKSSPTGSPIMAAKNFLRTVEQHSVGQAYQHDDITLVCFGRKV
jgi:serine phosphatase RsbU (regulator of sigma subunit)/pSer/pThr/pTyr-binding forkhead associated (FHA) protein